MLSRPLGFGLCLAAAIWMHDAAVKAEPVRFHLETGGARAISGALQRETSIGFTGAAAVELGLTKALGVQLELSTVALGPGDPPLDPTLAPHSSAGAQALLAGLRLRPFVAAYNGQVVSAAGLWLDANAGVAHTGDLTRGAFDTHIGFDFAWPKAALGPYAGYQQVLQPDDTLRPDDARMVLFGLHCMLGGMAPLAPPALPAPAPEVERDRDGDGIADARDKCPDAPEDKDGFEDEDGCPDPDNDKDKIPDVEDACPNDPGPRTPDAKTNGCPVRDRDQDGILDDDDKCPDMAEDKDGFEDQDGCPDPDNDKDGFLDRDDQCPNEAETPNGYADDDGCPDDVQVRVVGDYILLDERIHFDTGKSIVLLDSQPLLWRVMLLIKKHPEYAHIEVEGYADERGEESYNHKLSEARAQSVRNLLVRWGVAPNRVSSAGFGTSNPRVPNKSYRAYRANRRVEFKIT
ncbi:MAG TPA: OmpA family protein, partial [Polyangiaceae bacterium]|nr:OmpA family protein [Polyangiaceae bacterium]